MRWILTVTVLMVAMPVYAGDNEGEKLFRQMEKKIKAAKTLQIEFELVMTILGMQNTFKGDVTLGEGDKLHLNAAGAIAGMDIKVTVIGDGTKIYATEKNKQETKIENSPKGLGVYFRNILPRGGVFAGIDDASKGKDLPDVDDKFKISDFKLGAKEKVGTAETRLVEYTLLVKGKDKAAGKVWINTKTLLPAKLEVKMDMGGIAIELSESYSQYTIDGKVDPKLFQAPK
jgi:hypothetical protein